MTWGWRGLPCLVPLPASPHTLNYFSSRLLPPTSAQPSFKSAASRQRMNGRSAAETLTSSDILVRGLPLRSLWGWIKDRLSKSSH